jgi:SAM-dependent methyltransferase
VEGERLAYYASAADPDFWDCYWSERLSARTYGWAEQGKLWDLEKPFTKYLPRQGRILEAGCGLGQYVLALCVRGYECEGIEWGGRTVEAVHAIQPDLPISAGDVTRLDVLDGTYQGYISLGVVEHRQEGPEPYLAEAYRVVADDGVLLISVPCFHRLRRFKARLNLYRGTGDGAFYQYAFTSEEMGKILKQNGFALVETYGYEVFTTVADEVPLLRQVVKWRPAGGVVRRVLRPWKWVNQNLGHMMLFVCKKDLRWGLGLGNA